jgi:hypothetical protein
VAHLTLSASTPGKASKSDAHAIRALAVAFHLRSARARRNSHGDGKPEGSAAAGGCSHFVILSEAKDLSSPFA